MKEQLVYPMGFYVFYISGLFIYNFMARSRAAKAGEFSAKYYKTYANKESVPERLLVLERHVDNQFQLPLIFLITCLAHMTAGDPDGLTVALAWTFVALRMGHSYIHLGSNKVLNRAKVFALGLLAIWALWIQLIIVV